MNTFEKIIKDHLEKMAQGDAVFAQKFYDRCEKEKDAIKDCCSYITSEAKKQAQCGCAVVEDAEVFGWAIHFFDENIQKPKGAPRAEVKTAEKFKDEALNPAKRAVSRPNPKPKAPKVDECQLSLF